MTPDTPTCAPLDEATLLRWGFTRQPQGVWMKPSPLWEHEEWFIDPLGLLGGRLLYLIDYAADEQREVARGPLGSMAELAQLLRRYDWLD